jgi:flavin-dependent dehydrogenase
MLADYDVAIMGGGPGGSSLAARLAKTNLRTIIFERCRFPREHIGESFASPAIPCLSETGALGPVLESNCWIRKFGGYYSWDSNAPSTSYFRHRLWERDHVRRWSIHVDRASFDHILLAHARSCGAQVVEDSPVDMITTAGSAPRVRLRSGREMTCRLFVDASGRMNRATTSKKRGWLSSYRNIAIWTHFVGGLPAQSLRGDWNIFLADDLSPIGCFAFDLGWVWYIPVIQNVNGRPVHTHSIGIVTDPKVLREPATRLTDLKVFLATLRSIPLLCDLIHEIEPIRAELRTATNYSMINPSICDYDERRIAIGDAAFFVDPLFSSGVSFAMLQAACASRLVEATLRSELDEDMKRELWDEYRESWTLTATSFAAKIDQWYAAIAHGNPNSVYWHERTSDRSFIERMNSFEWLIDADVTSDLIHVITRGSDRLDGLRENGAVMQSLRRLMAAEPRDDMVLRLRPGVVIRRSMTLRASSDTLPDPWAHGAYWLDPLNNGKEVAPIYSKPAPCFRFQKLCSESPRIQFFDETSGRRLVETLGENRSYGELRSELTSQQWNLLLRLIAADLIEAQARDVKGKSLILSSAPSSYDQ